MSDHRLETILLDSIADLPADLKTGTVRQLRRAIETVRGVDPDTFTPENHEVAKAVTHQAIAKLEELLQRQLRTTLHQAPERKQ